MLLSATRSRALAAYATIFDLMKQPLRPQWQDVSHDAAAEELAAAAETEQGLEDFADLFAAELNQLQQEQQQPPKSAPSANNKRRRSHRELVSINFGSQDAGGGQTADAATMQDDEDVDLITPPWLQPQTKARKSSNPSAAGSRLAQHTIADADLEQEPAQDAAMQRAGQVQHQGRPPQRTPPAPVPAPASAAAAAAHAPGLTPVHAAANAPGHAADLDQEEDIICDNSSDDFEPLSSTRRVAARAVGSSAGKRPGSGHRPASAAAAAAAAAGHARTPASAGTGRLLDSLLGPSPNSAGRASTQQTQRQQHQQHQQFRPAGAAGDSSGEAWVPPKYKQPASTQGFAPQHTGSGAGANQHPQQQYRQQPSSTQRPPGLLERQQPAMAAAAAGAGGGQFGPGGYGVPGPCAGGADVDQAWWWVLPDFVPVEVLLQQQCNPRDDTPVYINYKSQFKDGGSAAAPKARAAPKQTKGKGKRGTAAAAAAAGPTGFMTAAWLDQQQGKGSGGRSKGRKRRSRKGKGAEGGSGGGSSGGRRKRGSGGGRWSTVNGQKVFISNNGSRLTGSSAYKAYKGIGK